MIVYYLFVHKNLFEREKFVLFSKKIKKFKKPKKTQKKTFLVGFFRWVFLGFFGCVFLGFLGGFFWVGFLMPTLGRRMMSVS